MSQLSNLKSKSVSGSGLGCQLVGDWELFLQFTQLQRNVILKAYDRGAEKAAKRFYTYIKEQITRDISSYGFAPVSADYSKRKRALGGNPQALFQLSGSYLQAIVIKRHRMGLYSNYSVGIPAGVQRASIVSKNHRQRSIEIAKYAKVLEEGSITRGIPARPLWKKAYSQKKFGGNRKVRGIIIRELAKAYRLLGINVKLT